VRSVEDRGYSKKDHRLENELLEKEGLPESFARNLKRSLKNGFSKKNTIRKRTAHFDQRRDFAHQCITLELNFFCAERSVAQAWS